MLCNSFLELFSLGAVEDDFYGVFWVLDEQLKGFFVVAEFESVGDEAVGDEFAGFHKVHNEVKSADVLPVVVLHSVAVAADDIEALPPDWGLVEFRFGHLIADLDERALRPEPPEGVIK